MMVMVNGRAPSTSTIPSMLLGLKHVSRPYHVHLDLQGKGPSTKSHEPPGKVLGSCSAGTKPMKALTLECAVHVNPPIGYTLISRPEKDMIAPTTPKYKTHLPHGFFLTGGPPFPDPDIVPLWS